MVNPEIFFDDFSFELRFLAKFLNSPRFLLTFHQWNSKSLPALRAVVHRSNPMPTTSRLRKTIKNKLKVLYNPREADHIAALIIEHLFGITTTAQLLQREIQLTSEIKEQLTAILQRLKTQEPIQYILGYTEFYGRRFKTDGRALIPRPETEELVHFAIQEGVSKECAILDIGTGTGCIAITMALETGCEVYAVDVSNEALQLARGNAKALRASVQFLQDDIMQSSLKLPELDLIISNPPYVPDTDHPTVASRVKDFEPSQALFVPIKDPLMFYKRIAQLAPEYLKPGGKVFLEIYHTAGPAVEKLFKGSVWYQVQIKKDLQGNDRMVKAVLKS